MDEAAECTHPAVALSAPASGPAGLATLCQEYVDVVEDPLTAVPSGVSDEVTTQAGLIFTWPDLLRSLAGYVALWFLVRIPRSIEKPAGFDSLGTSLVEELLGAAAVPCYCINPPLRSYLCKKSLSGAGASQCQDQFDWTFQGADENR